MSHEVGRECGVQNDGSVERNGRIGRLREYKDA
jgi:hypothetical protein